MFMEEVGLLELCIKFILLLTKNIYYILKSTLIICALLILIFFNNSKAQNGYVITNTDSLIEGFLKYKRSFETKKFEIELWRTKKDKNPLHYSLTSIKEYAIKKDTFRVVQNFHPFPDEDLLIDVLELSLIVRGKLSLYSTLELKNDHYPIKIHTGSAPMAPSMHYYDKEKLITYIIEDDNGNIVALDRNGFDTTLNRFLDYEKYARKVRSKKFRYKDIPELIRFYNKEMEI